jgi:hypothetical protein
MSRTIALLRNMRRVVAAAALVALCVAQTAVACPQVYSPRFFAESEAAAMPCADAMDAAALCVAGCHPTQALDHSTKPIALAPPPLTPLWVAQPADAAAPPAPRACAPAPHPSPPYLATARRPPARRPASSRSGGPPCPHDLSRAPA